MNPTLAGGCLCGTVQYQVTLQPIDGPEKQNG